MEIIFKKAEPLIQYHGFCVAFHFVEKMGEDIIGQSYYKAAVHPDKYMGSDWLSGAGSTESDLKWARCLFYSLNMFLKEYYNLHEALPSSGTNQGSEFIDGLSYRFKGKMHLPGIYYRVTMGNELNWENARIDCKDLSVSTSVSYI